MSRNDRAVQLRRAALFVCLGTGAIAIPAARAQSPTRGALDQIVQQAVAQVQERYSRSLGSVAERRRDRVFVLLRQLPPPAGTMLEVVREGANGGTPRVVARIEVLNTEAGVTECAERERVGRAHAEDGDTVRRPLGSARVLLAPCVPLLEIAPEIPEVIGERIRSGLATSTALRLVDSPETERRAEAAYWASAAGEFAARQSTVDEVLYPVLMQTPGKLVLNLEYYSVQRGRASDIDVASVALDDLMRAWLRAGHVRQGAPPGFRRLPPQTQTWRVTALGEAPGGDLVVLAADSVHVLRLQFPGLRVRYSAPLGPRARRRREPWSAMVSTRDLHAGGAALDAGAGVVLLSDERRPMLLAWSTGAGPEALPQLRPLAAEHEAALERLWTTMRSPARRPDSRWWPAPGQQASVIAPGFADLDGDAKLDAAWSGADGLLQVKLGGGRSARTFADFGDVKAVHAARGNTRGMLWLTDPVWRGEPDRLHATQLAVDELQIVWSSEPFEGTITAVASVDLNGDGAADLVVAEDQEGGTRVHAFLAFSGGSSAPRTGSGPDAGGRR